MAKCDNCKELEVKNIWGKVPFEWCEKKNDNPDKNIERDCPYFKPKTNADRIRNMTDEELAKFLGETVCEAGENMFYCSDYENTEHCIGHSCKECGGYLKWLKSEVVIEDGKFDMRKKVE